MAKRAFSRELYEAYDGTAKAALVKILEDEGHEIVAIAENYYADVMSMKDGVPYYSEAEIKTGVDRGVARELDRHPYPRKKDSAITKI
jgi:hypothetical protein